MVLKWDTPFTNSAEGLLGYSGHTSEVKYSAVVCTSHAFWVHHSALKKVKDNLYHSALM